MLLRYASACLLKTQLFSLFAVVVNIESSAKGDASSGLLTHEKKTRFKRAAKEELTPAKLKNMKLSQDCLLYTSPSPRD